MDNSVDKHYDNEAEERWRYEAFFLPIKSEVDYHNRRFDAGKETYGMKFTQEDDRSPKEKLKQNWWRVDPTEANKEETIDRNSLPDSIDWRKKGVVTAVKAQGGCGSCYAFAAVAAIESAAAIAGHKLTNLSEQQIIDCDKNAGDLGCNGGLPHLVMEYVLRPEWCPGSGALTPIKKLEGRGIMSSESYPYNPYDPERGPCCKYDESNAKVHLDGLYTKANNKELDMAQMLQKGPFSVSIHASAAWKSYNGTGVFNGPCLKDYVSHSVLVVGFQKSSPDGPYWIIKNSHGQEFGDKGYIRMSFGNNTCAIRAMMDQPYVKPPKANAV